jgi:hypothetical protein
MVANANDTVSGPGRPVPVEELRAEVEAVRRAVAGSHCCPGGPELPEDLATAIVAVSTSGMTPGAAARRFPYRRDPYGRATIPTGRGPIVVDGKVLRTENGPLVEFSRHYGNGKILDVYIPGAWVRPNPKEQSGWVGVYDITEAHAF